MGWGLARTGNCHPHTEDRPVIEVLTVEMPALLIPMHDAYHLRQVAQGREAF